MSGELVWIDQAQFRVIVSRGTEARFLEAARKANYSQNTFNPTEGRSEIRVTSASAAQTGAKILLMAAAVDGSSAEEVLADMREMLGFSE